MIIDRGFPQRMAGFPRWPDIDGLVRAGVGWLPTSVSMRFPFAFSLSFSRDKVRKMFERNVPLNPVQKATK
jgi:hypothetical protein